MTVSAEDLEASLAADIAMLGFSCFGWFVMSEAPFTGRGAVLIGNRAQKNGHGMWRVFRTSAEFYDGEPNPLDRWTKRVIDPIAARLEAVAIYPFGSRVWPFQQFAMQSTGMRQSPLGLLVHPQFGLWHAFRAVVVFRENVVIPIPQKLHHPCEGCEEKPCLTTCPVDAFSVSGFAVETCRAHLATGADPDCMTLGCRARAACPVGIPYSDEQIVFHMRAFGPKEKN